MKSLHFSSVSNIAGLLFILWSICACENKESEALSFHIDGDVTNVQKFAWGETRAYKLSTTGSNRIIILSVPKGWSATIDNKEVRVVAPQATSEIFDSKGSIVLFAFDNALQIDLNVEIPTSAIIDLSALAIFDESDVLWALGAKGDTIAQVCREYVRSSNATVGKGIRASVVYLYDDSTGAFSKGFVMNNGGGVERDGNGYRDGKKLVTEIAYIVDGKCCVSGNRENVPTAWIVPETVSDVEGNIYGLVKIGTQFWMRENLRTGKYRDGSEIGNQAVWYKDDQIDVAASESLKKIFGRQYRNTTLLNRTDLAPLGWKVATDDDWGMMERFLGMPSSDSYLQDDAHRAIGIADLLKSSGTEWADRGGGSNLSGFTLIPGGSGGETSIKINAYYWSCNDRLQYPIYRLVTSSYSYIIRSLAWSGPAMSVRCVKSN